MQRIANETRSNQANLQALEQSLNWIHHEFLAGFTLPEAPDFEDWLEPRRESLRRDVDGVLQALTTAQVEAGQPLAALATARRRVQLDTMNENAHRAVIELHLQTGDRAAALEAYRTCQQVFEKELGITPSSETEALAERARAGAARVAQVAQVAQVVTVLAPVTGKAGKPQAGMTAPFVGREREWTMLEDAWNDGLIAFVAGEPGSGKSRLMQEFMRTKQTFVALENRPGDAGVPYASLARHLRALLKSQAVTLEPWVNSELARILPECGEAPAPIQSEQGKLRFFQAIVETFQSVIQANENLTALLYDDAQFTDTSSSEATRFVLEQLDPDARAQLRILYGYRKNELPAELEADLKQTLIAGEGVLIELEPLSAGALEALLQGLTINIQPEDLAGISRTLEQFTGGNPLFVLETVKSLTESQHGEQWTAIDLETMRSENRLPKSSKVKQVIERRLDRLSKPAKDLVRVAAVMGQEYTLERAAKVLEADQLVLAEASEELEGMGIVLANRFTHDLIFEASYEGVPKAAKPLLHSRVLDAFEGGSVPAADLVKHAFAAGDHERIVRYSFEAVRDTREVWALPEGIAHLERLREYHLKSSERFGERFVLSVTEIARLYEKLRANYIWSVNRAQARVVTDEYLEQFRVYGTIETRCAVLINICEETSLELYSTSEVLEFAEQAIDFAKTANRKDLLALAEMKFSEVVGHVLTPEGGALYKDGLANSLEHSKKGLAAAEEFFGEGKEINPMLDSIRDSLMLLSWSHLNLAYAFFNLGFLKEAEFHHEKAMLIDESREKFRNSSWYCYIFALVKVSLGKISEAEQLGLKAIETVTQWVPIRHYLVYIPLFSVYAQQGKYAKIHRFIEELERNSPEDHAHRFFKQYRGILVFKNGDFENAKQFWIQGLKYETQVPEHDLLLFFESALCAATVMLNDWSAALDYSKQAIASRNYPSLPYVEGSDYWHFETIALLHSGEMEVARADIQAREPHVAKWSRYLLPHLRSRAVLERYEGRHQAAISSLSQSLELATEIGMPAERWQLESDIAHIHDQIGNQNEALAARSRATQIRDMIASWMPDETMRNTYLAFTQKQIDVPLWKWPDTSTPA